jgi:hypothetical protein
MFILFNILSAINSLLLIPFVLPFLSGLLALILIRYLNQGVAFICALIIQTICYSYIAVYNWHDVNFEWDMRGLQCGMPALAHIAMLFGGLCINLAIGIIFYPTVLLILHIIDSTSSRNQD